MQVGSKEMAYLGGYGFSIGRKCLPDILFKRAMGVWALTYSLNAKLMSFTTSLTPT